MCSSDLHGGGFPLSTKNEGLQGILLISGLPQVEDHKLAVEILKRYLAKPSQNKTELVRIADLGSGGGLPAIPLAILEPDWSFTLIEASKKKAAFLQHVRGGLGLKNVHVVSERVENISSLQTYSFDAVTARAFTRLNRLLDLSTNLLKSTGLVFAMKSQRSEEEMSEVKNQDWKLLEECPLTLPNQKLDRRLLIFKH